MAIMTFARSAATASWIDPRTGLPEVDKSPPGAFVPRGFLTGSSGFRFVNFMEVWANIDTETNTIVGHGFTKDSGLYRSLSYGGIPSQIGETIRRVQVGQEPITFTQITGARTQSPEKIGGIFGPGGNIFASAVKAFPPIWTEIQMKLFNDGNAVASVLRYSLFPSMTFYAIQMNACGYSPEWGPYTRTKFSSSSEYYDGMPNYQRWYDSGWGSHGAGAGPITGNPWGMEKTVLTGIDPTQPFGW